MADQVSAVVSQQEGAGFDQGLCMFSLWGFSGSSSAVPTVEKHALRTTGDSELLLSVSVRVNGAC